MTRVDFYVFPQNAPFIEAVLPAVCRICEKAGSIKQRVYVHSHDRSVAEALDGMLWSFRQGSFVSHERIPDDGPLEQPIPTVLIGSCPPADHLEVMINLASNVPPFFSRFERVLEIVQGDTTQRASSRLRYRYYKDRGYPLFTHEIAKSGGRHRQITANITGDSF